MRDINRRINYAEKKLNVNEEPRTLTIVMFGGELPPDTKVGNLTIHCEMYGEKTTKSNEKQPNTER